MATAATSFPSYNRSIPSTSVNFHMSDNSTLSKQNQNFFTNESNSVPPRIGHCLDDMAILSLKRQYANMDLFEQSTLSNSAEDLSQFERNAYPYDMFSQDQNDLDDDDDLPYDAGFDYAIAIQERLKKANEDLQQDQTPSELKHSQRVSFDALVKAVDIVQDPSEHENVDPLIRPSVSPVVEEPTTIAGSPRSDASTHEYTVPLNDTQPKEGLTLLQQIKALQFQTTSSLNERWAAIPNNGNNDSARDEDVSTSSFKSNENHVDSQDLSNSTSLSTFPKKSMVVAVNGQFDLQNEDDYTAKKQVKSTNNENNQTTIKNKSVFVPKPPTEPKSKKDSTHRPLPVRPKSASDKKTKTDTNHRPRARSAGVSKTVEKVVDKPPSGVDFNGLLRKAAEKKRAELKEERRKQTEAEEKRQKDLAKAKESYQRWLEEKESERKRIIEAKRLEKEQEEARQAEQAKELSELREKKYKEWLERKEHEAAMINEFKKLQANEEAVGSGSSLSSINNNKTENHRAFQRWLRRKYLESLEEKRRLRLEAKRERRRQRRSIKRNQLQQDLQLAKAFGYT